MASDLGFRWENDKITRKTFGVVLDAEPGWGQDVPDMDIAHNAYSANPKPLVTPAGFPRCDRGCRGDARPLLRAMSIPPVTNRQVGGEDTPSAPCLGASSFTVAPGLTSLQEGRA